MATGNYQVQFWNRIGYAQAMDLMNDLHRQRCRNEIPDTILVLEHDPVVTRGRRMNGAILPHDQALRSRGIAVCDADRGGLLTYHGPGQVVMYFILRLQKPFGGINDLVCRLEKGIQKFLKGFHIQSQIRPDHPGVWLGGKKIASLGLRVQDGVTKHGISVNLTNDLSVYHLFDPCGQSGAIMTRLVDEAKVILPEPADLFRLLAQDVIAELALT